MTAADKRVAELLDRWLASVELHAQYLGLDAAAYARSQDWPKHQRPTRWLVELARTRLLELKAKADEYRQRGDDSFPEALELMSFLTTLLGSEHIDRFIPLATGKPADPAVSGTVERPRLRANGDKSATGSRKTASKQSRSQAPAAARSHGDAATPPTAKAAASASARAAQVAVKAPAAAKSPAVASRAQSQTERMVIADAVRFLEWGREWPALASQIARLADRPPEAEVRAMLRTHREAILQRARRPAD
jgi:hypothetical protein